MSEGSLILASMPPDERLGSDSTVFEALIGRLSHERSNERLRRWALGLVEATRTTLLATGQEHIPKTPCVLMSNHQSYGDIPLIYASIPEDPRLRMVAKYELFYVPIWGGRCATRASSRSCARIAKKRSPASMKPSARLAPGTYV